MEPSSLAAAANQKKKRPAAMQHALQTELSMKPACGPAPRQLLATLVALRVGNDIAAMKSIPDTHSIHILPVDERLEKQNPNCMLITPMQQQYQKQQQQSQAMQAPTR